MDRDALLHIILGYMIAKYRSLGMYSIDYLWTSAIEADLLLRTGYRPNGNHSDMTVAAWEYGMRFADTLGVQEAA